MNDRPTTDRAFQDSFKNIHCFGCGPDNELGLRIKSTWSGKGTSVCRYTPKPHQCAGPHHVVNGGIIATLIDCHCVCTAMAGAYLDEGREVGQGEEIHFATGALNVTYLRPVPISEPLTLNAVIEATAKKKTILSCTVTAGGKVCAKGEVVAVRVPLSWKHPPA